MVSEVVHPQAYEEPPKTPLDARKRATWLTCSQEKKLPRTREGVHGVHELLLRGREVRVLLAAEVRGLAELRLRLGNLPGHLRGEKRIGFLITKIIEFLVFLPKL